LRQGDLQATLQQRPVIGRVKRHRTFCSDHNGAAAKCGEIVCLVRQ
jgi:hypothetical protein